VGVTAKKAVHGIVGASKDVGVGVGDAAKATLTGAVDAIGSVGMVTVGTAKNLLVGLVGGVKEAVNTALPSPAKEPAKAAESKKKSE